MWQPPRSRTTVYLTLVASTADANVLPPVAASPADANVLPCDEPHRPTARAVDVATNPLVPEGGCTQGGTPWATPIPYYLTPERPFWTSDLAILDLLRPFCTPTHGVLAAFLNVHAGGVTTGQRPVNVDNGRHSGHSTHLSAILLTFLAICLDGWPSTSGQRPVNVDNGHPEHPFWHIPARSISFT